MKPVVSSIVALAIAMAPMSVFAGPKSAHPASMTASSASAKTSSKAAKGASSPRADAENAGSGRKKSARHDDPKAKNVAKKDKARARKVERVAKVAPDETYESTERIERSEKSIVVRVRHVTNGRSERGASPSVEARRAASKPAVERDLIPASLVTKDAAKSAPRSVAGASSIAALPSLPDPSRPKIEGKPRARKESLVEDKSERDALKKISDDEVAALIAQHAPAKGLSRVTATEPVKAAAESVKGAAEPVKGAAEPVKAASESSAARSHEGGRDKEKATARASKACTKAPVEVIRGPELEKFQLTRCDGSIAPLAIERLSVLVRPGSAARPTVAAAELAKKKGAEIARGIRRIDERLAYRLQSIVDHFTKPGATAKLVVVSGYRPTSIGSMHATGRAIDFRLEGVKNEEVISFCKTLNDTGCGFYPNSSFVHVDVREPGAGHVAWIDASGPGETPRYVPAWPPAEHAASSPLENAGARQSVRSVERELDEVPVDEHPDLPNASSDVTP